MSQAPVPTFVSPRSLGGKVSNANKQPRGTSAPPEGEHTKLSARVHPVTLQNRERGCDLLPL